MHWGLHIHRASARTATATHSSHTCPPRSTSTKTRPPPRQRALTFIEVIVTLVIVMGAAIGTIGAIVYSRMNMELEKQRIAALNYCRQSMEIVQCLDDAFASTKVLVPFNAPGVENLDANISVEYYKLTNTGTIDWTTSLTAPSLEEPTFARVSVEWIPYGSNNRPQQVSMSTVLTRGID